MTPRAYTIIVRARMRARDVLALSIGWHSEAFARTKRLKALPKYTEKPETPEQKRDRKSRELMAAFDKMEQRGKVTGNAQPIASGNSSRRPRSR